MKTTPSGGAPTMVSPKVYAEAEKAGFDMRWFAVAEPLVVAGARSLLFLAWAYCWSGWKPRP